MPQPIDAEDWPDDDRPAAIAYVCGVMPAPRRSVTDASDGDGYHEQVRERAVAFLDRNLRHLLPGAVDHDGFNGTCCAGAAGRPGPRRSTRSSVPPRRSPSGPLQRSKSGEHGAIRGRDP